MYTTYLGADGKNWVVRCLGYMVFRGTKEQAEQYIKEINMSDKEPFDQDELDDSIESLYDDAIEAYIEDHNTEEAYQETLNEVYGEVEVCGMTFLAGDILVELDSTAFRCGLADNEDSVREEAEDYINREDYRDEALEDLDMEEEEESGAPTA